jgi:hypothetical protein
MRGEGKKVLIYALHGFAETGGGMWETGGREFSVHLSCRGVGIDDPVPPFSSLPAANVTANGSGDLNAQGRETVRRTILIESDQGVSGAVGAEWVLKMLKDGELTSGDFETRVCFWDRPG